MTPKDQFPVSSDFAHPNYDELGNVVPSRQFGMGAGELKADKPGPGVRADKLAEKSAERANRHGFTKSEQRRLRGYRAVVNAAIHGATDEVLDGMLFKVYEGSPKALAKGGFLTEEKIAGDYYASEPGEEPFYDLPGIPFLALIITVRREEKNPTIKKWNPTVPSIDDLCSLTRQEWRELIGAQKTSQLEKALNKADFTLAQEQIPELSNEERVAILSKTLGEFRSRFTPRAYSAIYLGLLSLDNKRPTLRRICELTRAEFEAIGKIGEATYEVIRALVESLGLSLHTRYDETGAVTGSSK